MIRIKFWIRVLYHFLALGFPLKGLWKQQKLVVGFRNRGLLAYDNLEQYEPELQKLIWDIKEPCVFVDIGANIGIMSLVASKNDYIHTILALEPSSSIEQLKKNVPTKVNCLNLALIDAFDNGFLVTEKNAARDHIVSSDNANGGDSLIKTKDLIENHALSEQQLAVKVDIEGAEIHIDWSLWLKLEKLRMLAIEIWDLNLFENLQTQADELGFVVSVFDAKFENETTDFVAPVNLVLRKLS